jgi:hypothetical protein
MGCLLIVECSSGAKRERSDAMWRFQLERSDNLSLELSEEEIGG